MRYYWLRWLLVAVGLPFGLIALSLTLARIAEAQGLPPAMHNMEDPNHWYDYDCCSLKDCGPAKSKVREGPNGYVVTQLGEVIPYNHKKVRQSKDGEFHVCERKSEYEGSRIICLYVPPRAF